MNVFLMKFSILFVVGKPQPGRSAFGSYLNKSSICFFDERIAVGSVKMIQISLICSKKLFIVKSLIAPDNEKLSIWFKIFRKQS